MPVNVPTSEEFDALAQRVQALEDAATTPDPEPPVDPPVEPEPEPEPEPPVDPVQPVPSGLEIAYDAATREPTLWWAAPRTGNVVLTRNDSTNLFGSTTQVAALGTYKFGAHRSTATWVELTISAGGETITGRFPAGTSFTRRTVTPTPPPTDPTPVEPPPPTGTLPKLTWAPPTGYQNFPKKTLAITTQQQIVNGGGGDVLVVAPAATIGPVIFDNCRNIVWIGGSLKALGVSKIGTQDQRLVQVRNSTGVAHFEGLLLDGSTPNAETDGFVANGMQTTLRVQNCRVVGLDGLQSTNHADVIQTWNGIKALQVDRLSGYSDYQGIKFQTVSTAPDTGPVTLRNVDLHGLGTGTAYLYWMDPAAQTKIDLFNVRVHPYGTRGLGRSVWPGNPPPSGVTAAQIVDGRASWPHMPTVTGYISLGKSTDVDFVPDGVAGLNYVSPGYVSA